jgi:hypothetical protein
MTDPQTIAITALREAASVLGSGRDAHGDGATLPEGDRPGVAGEVAYVLDALIELLRSIDSRAGIAERGTGDLDPVLAHLASGATLARSVQDRRADLPPAHPPRPSDEITRG